MRKAEATVAERFLVVGIGVGLFADYGSAQRMYAKRGYIPDGRGLFNGKRFLQYGEQVIVNDDLTLQFTKQLR
jgi:hypothetical protein